MTQHLSKCIVLLFLVLVAGAVNAAGGDSIDEIRVTDAWSRATPPGTEVGVVYFVIANGGKSDRLVRVSSPIAARSELHITRMDGKMMTMQHVDTVDVKAEDSTSFAPGGRHVMLIGLKRPLKERDVFPLVLTFENAGPLEIQVHVRAIGGMSESGHPMDHSK